MAGVVRDRIAMGYWGAALAGLGWICLAPWPLTEAPSDIDRRSLLWVLGLVASMLPMLCWPAMSRLGPVLLLAVLLWLAADVLSASLALHPWVAWVGGPERGLGVLDHVAWVACLLALHGALLIGDAKAAAVRSDRIIGGLIAVGAVMALLLLTETAAALLDGRIERAAGMQRNAAYSASVLAPLLVLALGRGLSFRPVGRGRWLVLLLLAAGLLVTGSRAALLAALAGATWLCLGRQAFSSRPGRNVIAWGWLSAGLLLLIAAFALWQLRPASVEIRSHLYRAAALAPLEQTALKRWDGVSDPFAARRIWIGYGRDNLEPGLTRLRVEALNALEARGHDRLADRSHSGLLDRWMEGGLLALGAALLLLGLLGRRSRDGVRHSGVERPDAADAALLTTLLDRAVGVPSAGADLLLALLLALCLARWLDPARATAAAGRGKPLAGRTDGFLPGAASLPALLLVAAVLAASQQWLWRDAGSPAGTSADPPQRCLASLLDAPAAIASLRQPYSIRPWLGLDPADLARCPAAVELGAVLVDAAPSLPRVWLLRSGLALEAGDNAAAHLALKRALELLGSTATDGPDSRRMAYLWARLASASEAELQRDVASRAVRALQAVGPDPQDAAWWRTIGYMHALRGDAQAAIAAYTTAIAIDPADQPSRRNLQRLQQATMAVAPAE